jgi:membrane-associated phospholipid phosphatase
MSMSKMEQGQSNKQLNLRQVLAQILTQALNTPIVAAVAVTWVMFQLPGDLPGRWAGWGYALLFLTIIPLLSLFFYIPLHSANWKQVLHRQRVASFVFMAVSYPVGLLVLNLIGAPKIYVAILTSYVAIVVGLILVNLFYKASGHAAGVTGPVVALVFLCGWIALPLLVLLPLVGWARVQLHDHTVGQIVVGGLLSAVITLLTFVLYGFPVGVLS